jgi:hypothetical protein
MSEWIHTRFERPLHDEKVIYWSSRVGMWRGTYDRLHRCFYGKGGFLDVHDVECWQRDEGQNMPKAETIPEDFHKVREEWLARHKV